MPCRYYNAQQALDMGLVNTVVPVAELEAEGVKWARERSSSTARSPSAASRAPSTRRPDGQSGIQELAGNATLLYYMNASRPRSCPARR